MAVPITYDPEFTLTPNEANHIHGNDERISLQNVRDAVQVALEILQEALYG